MGIDETVLRPPEPDAELRAGLAIGVMVGVPAAVVMGAGLALFRSVFDATNAALVLMIVVVAVAALGGRAAGIVTALAAVASFDFFHTQPYLSLAIDSRDDIETTALLLVAAVLVGTLASWGRTAARRAGAASSEVRRIHHVAETAVHGAAAAEVIAVAQDELRELLTLRACRFEALPSADLPGPPAHRPLRCHRGGGGPPLRPAPRRRRRLRAARPGRRAARPRPGPAGRPVRARAGSRASPCRSSSASSPSPSPTRWPRCGSPDGAVPAPSSVPR